MVERSEKMCLASKTRQTLGSLGHLGGQNLDGHVASQLGIPGAVDLAHSSCTNGGENFVGTE